LNFFRTVRIPSTDWRAVGVGQKQPHCLDIAGIAQFAEFLGEPFAIDRLP
jgi:hypothetical protein